MVMVNDDCRSVKVRQLSAVIFTIISSCRRLGALPCVTCLWRGIQIVQAEMLSFLLAPSQLTTAYHVSNAQSSLMKLIFMNNPQTSAITIGWLVGGFDPCEKILINQPTIQKNRGKNIMLKTISPIKHVANPSWSIIIPSTRQLCAQFVQFTILKQPVLWGTLPRYQPFSIWGVRSFYVQPILSNS